MKKTIQPIGPDRLLLIRGEWILATEPHASRLMKEAEKVMVEGDPAFDEFIAARRQEVTDSQSTSMRKFREALIVSDIQLATVTAAIEVIEDTKEKALVKNYWETETKVKYNDKHLQKIRELLSLNLDNIFNVVRTL